MNVWRQFKEKYPGTAQFLVFFMISNGVTVLQIIMMPVIKYLFGFTPLADINFQIMPAGTNLDGSIYYIFDYASGSIGAGGGGGLAYFLAVEITLFIAQVINFFLQRSLTFQSESGVARAAFWYFVAWVLISVGAAALQGLYKTPVYQYFMNLMGERAGMMTADLITMLINCVISFWIFFPIMKLIFKDRAR